jgi:hypothetical protein
MEQSILDSGKKGHDAIITAISDFDKAGYLVNSICFKDGALEVVCCPSPEKKGSKEGANWISLGNPESSGKEKSSSGLSMDGISETVNP